MTRAELEPAPRVHLRMPPPRNALFEDAQRRRHLELAGNLLRAPTAPYAEDLQLAALRRFADEREGLSFRLDRHGNAFIEWKGVGRRARSRRPLLAYSAHLDHPGFEYLGRCRGVLLARFHGGCSERHMPGAAVRFYDLESGIGRARAHVLATHRSERGALYAELAHMTGSPCRGMPGMWDLTPGSMRGTRLHARVCDDLLGAAAILCVLDLAWRERAPKPLLGIFTRAEETGFVGCQALLRAGELPRDLAVVGLECSPRRAAAKVGQGPVLRAGDAASVFDPLITRHLHEVALKLRREVDGFRFQRALMDGGRCESTAYNLWGVPAGGLCLALGNYHNCGPDRKIAPEYVDWLDFEDLVGWLREAARAWPPRLGSEIMDRLQRTWVRERTRLAVSARRVQSLARAR